MPLITDPAFYAVAVPAAFLVGIGKSGVAGGFGILAVPLIALVMPVPQAAAIVLPLLTVGDLFGLAALIRQRDRALLRVLLPAGLAGTVIGFALFGVLAPKTVSAEVVWHRRGGTNCPMVDLDQPDYIEASAQVWVTPAPQITCPRHLCLPPHSAPRAAARSPPW